MDQQPSSGMNQMSRARIKAPDEKFCGTCGEIIKIKAEICPKCGVRQRSPVNKAALLLITFFLGGIGAHKFYTGRYWQGVFYILFCWTGIPGLIALIEFIIYAFTSREALEEKYSSSGGGVVVIVIAAVVGFFFVMGILAAIAIPQFVAYRNRAAEAAVISELQQVMAAQNAYYVEHNKYSADLNELEGVPGRPEITVNITRADENCFEAIGKHARLEKTFSIDCNGLQ